MYQLDVGLYNKSNDTNIYMYSTGLTIKMEIMTDYMVKPVCRWPRFGNNPMVLTLVTCILAWPYNHIHVHTFKVSAIFIFLKRKCTLNGSCKWKCSHRTEAAKTMYGHKHSQWSSWLWILTQSISGFEYYCFHSKGISVGKLLCFGTAELASLYRSFMCTWTSMI